MDEGERRSALPENLHELFPDGGGGRVLRVGLPEGSLVWPDVNYPQHQIPDRPAYWVSEDRATGALWARLRAEHPRSGLWPLLLDDSAQAWSTGQIAPEPVKEIDNYDAGAFLAEVWTDVVDAQGGADDEFEDLAPFGRECPGLAGAGVLMEDPGVVADWYARILGDRGMPVGLVAVERGADALAAMGWQGALNHNAWTAPLAAVVRSWEERFGARVVAVGFNCLELSVAAPPVTTRHALHVAAEHWAFCPENLVQGPGTLAGYAEEIRNRNTWSFWWD
ncbi:DUF4253 domain-containing protein [Rhizohabitans arisaemae]|uniref:DUF4253 domain-containing protein n=1 Tax=Rhizohabitans arisaemae TaxID=2720610 RepID=UPI0024B10793|nr:DUF4253 domain-containing protein [Rhizohabitans arisaemae]